MGDTPDESNDNKIIVKVKSAPTPEPAASTIDEEVAEVEAEGKPGETDSADAVDAIDTDEESNESTDNSDDTPEQAAAAAMAKELKDAPRSPFEQPKKNRKKLAIAVAVVIAGVSATGLSAWTLMKNNQGEIAATSDTSQEVVSVQRTNGELALIDGAAQVSTDNVTWNAAKVGDKLAEGSYYKTNTTGRLVINLDDGSAIRLNNNSTVKLDSLVATNVTITNIAGETYTRLVKSERTFKVNVGDESYSALGTAYVTVNTETARGVEVYESKVKLEKANVEVAEGKYYYLEAKDSKKAKKLTTISVEDIKKNAFVKWNYEQDKKNKAFKDALGYLKKIDEKVEEEKEDEDTQSKEGVVLSGTKYDTGVKLSWTVKDVSTPKGFKVLRSLSVNPTFGANSTESLYLSDAAARSYSWSIKDGKTYHFRVCTYTGSSCNNYSNDVAVTAPKVESSSAGITLTHMGGDDFKWSLSGEGDEGFKLLWSKGEDAAAPTYSSNNGMKYFGESDRSGEAGFTLSSDKTYKFRICIYTGSSCGAYSNTIVVD